MFRFLDQSYKQLLELTASNLQCAVTNVTYHLAQLMHKSWGDGDGASEDEAAIRRAWERTINVSGQLSLKIVELKTVIGRNGTQLRSFFRWLNKALARLSAEPQNVDDDGSDFDEFREADVVIQFVRDTFMKQWSPASSEQGDTTTSTCGPLFRLERVGQYLEAGPLALPLQPIRQDWWTELERDLHQRGSLFFQHDPSASLFDLIQRLKVAVGEAGKKVLLSYSNKVALSTSSPDLGASVGHDEEQKPCKVLFYQSASAVGTPPSSVVFVCSRPDSEVISLGQFDLGSAHSRILRTIDLRLRPFDGCCLVDFDLFVDDLCLVLTKPAANGILECSLWRRKVAELLDEESTTGVSGAGDWRDSYGNPFVSLRSGRELLQEVSVGQLISTGSDRVCRLLVNPTRRVAAALSVTRCGIRLLLRCGRPEARGTFTLGEL